MRHPQWTDNRRCYGSGLKCFKFSGEEGVRRRGRDDQVSENLVSTLSCVNIFFDMFMLVGLRSPIRSNGTIQVWSEVWQ